MRTFIGRSPWIGYLMKPIARFASSRWLPAPLLLALLFVPTHAHASFLSGAALDTAANVAAWVVLIIAPTVAIVVFWLVHILPEKIAEKKQHPQAAAIQTLCLLSLVFGGMLWPIAWLWAYSKPVLYKMAYGTDKVAHGHEDTGKPEAHTDEAAELLQLRERVAELEAKSAGRAASDT